MRFSDVWDKGAFYLEKIVQERNSPQMEFVVRVNRYQYLMSYRELERLCVKYGVLIQQEISDTHIPRQHYDNRPLWKKDMDLRLGRTNTLTTNTLHLPSISADKVICLIGSRTKTA